MSAVAIKKMSDKNVSGLVVMDGKEIAGIITERDYLRKVILQGKSSNTTMVEEIMTDKVIFATLDQSVEECMAVMVEKSCRHLPVMDQGCLAGVISPFSLTGTAFSALFCRMFLAVFYPLSSFIQHL